MSANPSSFLLDGSAGEVLRGLTSWPKRLPARLFYDAEGSELFERITEQPEYYLTRTEESIFERHALEMVTAAGDRPTIIELGAGTARKTVRLLRAACRGRRDICFVPVDVSQAALEVAFERVRAELPQVAVHPLVMDYTRDVHTLAQLPSGRLVLYIGSSIGNFEPLAASRLLRSLRSVLEPGDALLLGTDMRKPVELLLAAYDDAAGVTAAFNLNILARLNREFGARFDLAAFEHEVRWNSLQSRIEMHLRSRREQQVPITALEATIRFEEGESIHTENSYKFTPLSLRWLAAQSGFQLAHTWSDERQWFTVNLLRA